MQTRDEHLAFCKKRAFKYLHKGEYLNAVTSMLSDLSKHSETNHVNNDITYLGMMLAKEEDYTRLLEWIEGFR